MKNFLGQLGKAICYILLFFGMQMIAMMVYMFGYGVMVGVKSAASGVMPDEMELVNEMTEALYGNLNTILIISGCLTLLFLWIFFLCRKKKLFVETEIRSFPIQYVPVIVVLGIALAAVVTFVLGFLPEDMLEAYAEESQLIIGDSITLTAIISNMILTPIVEEIIFRGLVLTRLKRSVPIVWAAVITSIIFGLAHGQIVWIAYATVLGLILCLVAIQTQSVAASILLHMVFNIFGTVVPTLCENCSMPVMAVIAAVGAVSMVLTLGIIIKKPYHKAENKAAVMAE